MAEFRTGVRLALDWGKARVGVAASDATGTLAYPVETVAAQRALVRIPELVVEYEPIEIVLGLPVDLRGERGIAAGFVLERASELAAVTSVPIVLTDERLSTVAASRRLGQAGKSARKQRAVIDQAAAVEILQAALEAERRGVRPEAWQMKETQA